MTSIFHERLQKLKEESGRTQVEIANALNITPQALSYYFNGREPNYELLLKIARYFEVSTDYLLGLNDFDSHETHISEKEIKISIEPYKKDIDILRLLPEIIDLPSFIDFFKVLYTYVSSPDKNYKSFDQKFTVSNEYGIMANLSIRDCDEVRKATILPFIIELLNDMRYDYFHNVTNKKEEDE